MEARSRMFKVAKVIQVSGEVDMSTAPKLLEKLKKAFEKRQTVIAELSGVKYMDSAGVAVLVEAFQWSQRDKVPFILAAPSEAAKAVIRMARLEKFFTIADTLEQALYG